MNHDHLITILVVKIRKITFGAEKCKENKYSWCWNFPVDVNQVVYHSEFAHDSLFLATGTQPSKQPKIMNKFKEHMTKTWPK